MEEPGRLQSMGCKELDTTKLLTLFYTHTHTYIHMHTHKYVLSWWLSGKEPVCQCRRCRFDPWIRNIPWRRKCIPEYSSILAWETPWTEEPGGLQSMGLQELDMT